MTRARVWSTTSDTAVSYPPRAPRDQQRRMAVESPFAEPHGHVVTVPLPRSGVRVDPRRDEPSVGLGGLARQHEPVAHVADGADERLVLRPELRAQPSDVDVDGPGAAEVVVAPDLLEQLLAGEDAARVLGQELEELELLEREVERSPADLRRVRRLVDDHLTGPDDVRLGV